MNPLSSPLLTDLYQLTMLQAYFEREMTDTAVFELFVRKLPPGRDFLVDRALGPFPARVRAAARGAAHRDARAEPGAFRDGDRLEGGAL